ncbi:acetylornithine deacetylase [Roseovarius sp. S1116L3]|uniref:acetylornithine deacetylase n=1 Tax=Roseovarius roseus TaxID=3342636 RepID=UPI00372A7254
MTPDAATLDILSRLIDFPTVSADSNLALIDYAEEVLQAAGFAVHRLPDPAGRKCGLLARIGPDGPGGVLLSAHSDVVPAEGQAWTRPPFALTPEGDRLYGRGTTDMKGFLASMLSLACRAGRANLTQPLMLSISYDEEVGCQGIAKMMPGFQQMGWQPELCIVGEPTMMRAATGHKGKAALRAICRGEAGHSALAPRHVNALHLAAEFITALRTIQDDYAASGVQDAAYDVPCSTVHAGRMQGGTALNIVPDTASIEFELRHLPADDLATFQARIAQEVARIAAPYHAQSRAAGIAVEVTNTYPGLEIPAHHPAVRRVGDLCGTPEVTKVAFGTEAGFFAGLGIPTVVCGPGSMEGQGHKADEFLLASQLAECDAMMERLLRQLA